MRTCRSGVCVAAAIAAAVWTAAVSAPRAASAPASARGVNLGCYVDNLASAPRYDLAASYSQFFSFYIVQENAGYRGVRVWFKPRVLGVNMACLYWGAVFSVGGIQSGDAVSANVYYWNGSSWERPGRSLYFTSAPALSQNLSQLGGTSPGNYSSAKVVFQYYSHGVWSFPRYVKCQLARTGLSSYNCSGGMGS